MAEEAGIERDGLMEPQRLDDFLNWEPHYPEAYIGGGVLYAQNKAIVYGRKNSFKSMFAKGLSLSLIDGTPWLHFDIKGEHRVIYLQFEIPHPLLHKRLTKMIHFWEANNGKTGRVRKGLYVWSEPYLKLDSKAGMAILQRALAAIKPTVLIIDPLYKTLSGNILDPNSARTFVDSLDKLIAEHNFSLVLIHHTRKGTLDEQGAELGAGEEDMLGSAVFAWWADTIIKVTKKGGHDRVERLLVNFDIVRHAEDVIAPREVMFNRDTLLFTPTDNVVLI